MTTQELEAMLKDVPTQAMQAFISRGMLLAQANGIDSKIRNAEKERDTAYNAANAEIETLQAARAAVQAQIDAL